MCLTILRFLDSSASKGHIKFVFIAFILGTKILRRGKYFKHCWKYEITTLHRWRKYTFRYKRQMEEGFLDRCWQNCTYERNKWNGVPQYEKQRTLQKNQLGTVIVNGMSLLILDTIKNASSKYIWLSTNNWHKESAKGDRELYIPKYKIVK